MTRPCDSQHSRRVLVIACAFPPTGGPGVQRTTKFVKYLPSFGWNPIVWASDPLPGLPTDHTLLRDVPDSIPVFRTRQDHAARIIQWLEVANGAPIRPGARRIAHMAHRMQHRRVRLLLPDDQIGWARRTIRAIRRTIDDQAPDVIYSTYSPASNHWIGLELKRSTGLPWVADFRDLWTDDYRYDERCERRQAAHRALEHRILESADAVIGVSKRQTEILAGHVPDQSSKFVTITNGFDPDDIPADRRTPMGFGRDGSSNNADRNVFRIAHIGRLCRRRTPTAFFDGLAKFAQSRRPQARNCVLDIVGHATNAVVERLRATGLTVRTYGQVHHAEAIERMSAASVLLLPIPEGPNAESVIPAKLFEYLAAGQPVVTIGPIRGETARIVTELRAGKAVAFDADRIAAALSKLHQAWRDGRPEHGCSLRECEPYSRVHLTRQLANIFDSLAAPRLQCGGAPQTLGAGGLLLSENVDRSTPAPFDVEEVHA